VLLSQIHSGHKGKEFGRNEFSLIRLCLRKPGYRAGEKNISYEMRQPERLCFLHFIYFNDIGERGLDALSEA
jgi:hypothetical protein